jgi:hypothetical protein
MTVTATDISISCSLIEDYLQLRDAPISPSDGLFAVVELTEGGQRHTHIMASDVGGKIVHFRPDAGSPSGWVHEDLDLKLAAPPIFNPLQSRFFASAGTLFAQIGLASSRPLAFAKTTFKFMEWTQGDGWKESSQLAALTSKLIEPREYISKDGTVLLYGLERPPYSPLQSSDNPEDPIIPTLTVLWHDPAARSWRQIFSGPVADDPTLAGCELIYLREGLQPGKEFSLEPMPGTVMLQAFMQGAHGSVEIGFVAVPLVVAGGVPVLGARGRFEWTMSQLTAIPHLHDLINLPSATGPDLTLIRQGGTLFLDRLWGGTTISTVPFPATGGASVELGQVAVGNDASGRTLIFAVSTRTKVLWVNRQDGTGPNFFGPWVPLGVEVAAIAAQPTRQAVVEAFYAGRDNALYRLSQGSYDTIWATRKIDVAAPPDEKPRRIAAMTMEVATLGRGRQPVGKVAMQIDPDHPVTLISDRVAYHCAPGRPIVITTDAAGRASVLYEAVSMSPPRLVFSLRAGAATTFQRWCYGDTVEVKPGERVVPRSPSSISERLADRDPTFRVDASSLAAAGLLAEKHDDSGEVVTAVHQIGAWMSDQGPLPEGQRRREIPPAWSIDFSKPGGPVFAYLPVGDTSARRSLFDVLDTSERLLGDAVSALKHGFENFAHIEVKALVDSIELVINQVDKFVITSLSEAGAVLELIFQKIADVVGDAIAFARKLIDWLKWLFEWDDIVRSAKVVRASVDFVFAKAESGIVGAKTTAIEHVRTARNEFVLKLETLKSYFEGQSINQVANKHLPAGVVSGPTGNVLSGSRVDDSYVQNKAACHYVQRNARASLTGATALTPTSSPSVPGGSGPAAAGDSAVSGASTSVRGLIDLSDPAKIFDLLIVDLIDALETLVTLVADGIEALVGFVLDAIAEAIKAFKTLLEAPFENPVMIWVLSQILGEEEARKLTLLDILCYMVAAPGTILYKVFSRGEAPYSEPDLVAVRALLAGNAGALARTQRRDGSLSLSLAAVQFFGGVFNLVATTFTAVADVRAIRTTPGVVAATDEEMKFNSFLAISSTLITQCVIAPWGLLEKDVGEWTVGEWAGLALYLGTWIPLGIDLITYKTTQRKTNCPGSLGGAGGLGDKIAKAVKLPLTGDTGLLLDVVLGAALFLGGLVVFIIQLTTGTGGSIWIYFNDFAQWSRFWNFLMQPWPGEEEWQPLVVAGMDAAFGIVNSATLCGPVVWKWIGQTLHLRSERSAAGAPVALVAPPWRAVRPETTAMPGAPVTAAWRKGKAALDLFMTGNDGKVFWTSTGNAWKWPSAWAPVQPAARAVPGSSVTAVWRPDDSALDLFFSAADGRIRWTSTGNKMLWPNAWTPLLPLDFDIAPGTPVTAGWRPNSNMCDLIVVGVDGIVRWTATDATMSWSQGWTEIDGLNRAIRAEPGGMITAVWRRDEVALDLFMTDADGTVQWTSTGDAMAWPNPWAAIRPSVRARPGAAVTALWRPDLDALDLFMSDSEGGVWWTSTGNAMRWPNDWTAIGAGAMAGQPGGTVTALWRPDKAAIDLFATATDGTVWWTSADATLSWSGQWVAVQPDVFAKTGVPVTATWNERLEIFMTGEDGTVWWSNASPTAGP